VPPPVAVALKTKKNIAFKEVADALSPDGVYSGVVDCSKKNKGSTVLSKYKLSKKAGEPIVFMFGADPKKAEQVPGDIVTDTDKVKFRHPLHLCLGTLRFCAMPATVRHQYC
jgi:hypothetical protein